MDKATPHQAGQLLRLLLGSYPTGRPTDPEIYATVIAATFADYPAEVGRDAVRTVHRRCKFLPAPAELTEALEEAMQPIRERQALEKARAERKRQIEERSDPVKRTPEELARVRAIVAELTAELSVDAADNRPTANHVPLPDDEREAILQRLSGGP